MASRDQTEKWPLGGADGKYAAERSGEATKHRFANLGRNAAQGRLARHRGPGGVTEFREGPRRAATFLDPVDEDFGSACVFRREGRPSDPRSRIFAACVERSVAVIHPQSTDGSNGTPADPARALALHAAVSAFFRRRLGADAEVEDLVQEVFVRAADQVGLDDEEYARAYVFRTAASVWADRHRRRLARRADQHVPFDPERHGETDDDPAGRFDARETLRAASAALLTLPERTRTIFVLRRIEGMTVREIASRLGISGSAVEKHMVKALERLLDRTGDLR
nr:sigma-70 family RNA polymerase sigma factor [Caulobacter sp. 602-2]